MVIHRAALALSLLAAGPARAGLVIEMSHREGRTSTFRIEGNRWRVDNSAPKPGTPGKAEIIIYDGAAKTMVFADPGTKTYKSVSQAEIDANRAAGEARLKEAMAKMTPEQRKRAEKLLTGETEGPDISWEKTDRTGSAAGHPCVFYRERMAGDPEHAEVCIAPFDEVGVRKEDFRAFLDLPGMKGAKNAAATMWARSPGVPLIRERRGVDGKLKEELRVTSLKRTSIPADAFQVPAGYTKKDLHQR